MSINELFNTANQESTSTSRGLTGTAELTRVANQLTSQVVAELDKHLELYADDFTASKTDHHAMDLLLEKLVDYDAVDTDFLTLLNSSTIDGMLKSQQSKRSRAKSKVMTLDNYKSMMAGAIAENLIRKTFGKEKSVSATRRNGSSVVFTEDQINELRMDQELLKKELRNVQSKKSIMKSKAGFSEEDERWQALLVAEAQLKDARITTRTTRAAKVDETKDKLAEVLGGVDPQNLKAADSKALIAQLKELISA